MMVALTEVMKKQPPQRMPIICGEAMHKAINEAIMNQWEILT